MKRIAAALAAAAVGFVPVPAAAADDCRPHAATLTIYTPVIDSGHGGLVTVKAAPNEATTFTLTERPVGSPDSGRVVFQGPVDADGRVDVDVAPTVNSEYAGTYGTGGPQATSPECPNGRAYADGPIQPQRMGVRTVLALSPAARLGTRTYRFAGSARGHVGDTVNLYRVDGYGRPVLSAQTTSRADGAYSITRTFSGTGTFVFYTASPSDPVNVGGLSNRIRVAIR